MPLDGRNYKGAGARPWTPVEDADLVEAKTLGFKWPAVAFLLDRPSGPCVAARYQKLIIRAEEAAAEAARLARVRPRTCLRCMVGFPSEHAGHRICDPCSDAASDVLCLADCTVHHPRAQSHHGGV